MGARLRGDGKARAIVSVIALYGLLLQSFLLAMSPAGSPLAASGAAGICAPGAGHGSDGGGPANHDPHGCCTAACAATPAPVPDPTSHAAVWPRREAALAGWGDVVVTLPTGPPVHAASARGPPSR